MEWSGIVVQGVPPRPSGGIVGASARSGQNDRMISERSPRRRLAVAASLVAIGLATLTPRPDQTDMVARTPPWCIVCGELGAVDVLLDLALFFPLGAALGLRGHRTRSIAALSLVVSIAVELLQAVIPGRDPTVSDVLTNTDRGRHRWAGGRLVASSHHAPIPNRGPPGVELGRIVAGPDRHYGRADPSVAAPLLVLGTAGTRPRAVRAVRGPRPLCGGRTSPDSHRPLCGVGADSRGAARRRDAAGNDDARRVDTGARADREHLRRAAARDRPAGPLGDELAYRLRTRTFDFRLRPPTIRLAGAFARNDTLVGVVGRFDPSAGSFVVTLRSADLERAVPLDGAARAPQRHHEAPGRRVEAADDAHERVVAGERTRQADSGRTKPEVERAGPEPVCQVVSPTAQQDELDFARKMLTIGASPGVHSPGVVVARSVPPASSTSRICADAAKRPMRIR